MSLIRGTLTHTALQRSALMRGADLGISRPFSCSHFALKAQTEKQKSDAMKTLNPRHIGVGARLYIPPSGSRSPALFGSPRLYFHVLLRRILQFGQNTLQIAIFRFQSKLKPQFLVWKNEAIETYISVNTAFAKRDLKPVRSQVSLWVEDAVDKRIKQLPEHIRLEWQLMKFNNVPKLVSVQPIMLPGQPLEHLQLTYRFNTKQRLIKLDKKTDKLEKIDRDVVDYMVYLCNAATNELILMGSVFESKPGDTLPANYEDNEQEALKNMKLNGDIYRVAPEGL